MAFISEKSTMTIAGYKRVVDPATFVMLNGHSQTTATYSQMVGGLESITAGGVYSVPGGGVSETVFFGGMYRQTSAASLSAVPIRLLFEDAAGGIDAAVGTGTTGMLSGVVNAVGNLNDCPVGSNYVDRFWTEFACWGVVPTTKFPKIHMVLTSGIIEVQLYGFER